MSSSQNERTLGVEGLRGGGGGGARKRARTNKGREGSKFGNFEETYFLNVPQQHSQQNILPDEHISPN